MTRLSAVPAPVLRDGVYVRVSAVMGRTDERFLSPEIQREAIDRARGRGPASRVVAQWDDIDVSTARVKAENRPGLQAALAAARDGRIDRLWFLTLDRFDRDTAALRAFDEIAGAGVELWTEAGRIDVESAEGYLSTTMQLAIARYQRDRIGKAWKQTHEHRVERGLPHSGKPRFGYVYDREQRMHVPDQATAPWLAAMYRRYLDGDPVSAIAGTMNAAGLRTTGGTAWSQISVRRVLDSGFAAGLLHWRGEYLPGAHEPVIDAATWEQYQAARAIRTVQHNRERSSYLLSGLLVCGHCGAGMSGGRHGKAGTARYTCRRVSEPDRHPGGIVTAAYVEAEVRAWLQDVADDLTAATDIADRAIGRQARRRQHVDELQAQADKSGAAIQSLLDHLAAGRILPSEFDVAVERHRTERERVLGLLAAEQAQAAAPVVVDPQRASRDLLAQWDVLPVAGRREMLRRLIREVRVTSGRPKATVEVVPSWD